MYLFFLNGSVCILIENSYKGEKMQKNTMKEKMLSGTPVIGPFVNFPSPAMVEMMGWLGMDFVIIDCEHGSTDYESAENMIRAAELSSTSPIVRIGMNIQQHIQRFLDAGAQGVLIPLVNNQKDAKNVVNSTKYPPLGKRGMFGGRSSMYAAQSMSEYVKEANEEMMVGLQIETMEGLENQDEIINTEGADLIFLGPGDLSSVFGIHGQMTNPKVQKTIRDMIPKIKSAGKQVGTLVFDGESAKKWIGEGVNCLVNSTNRFLSSGTSSYLEEVRKYIK